MKSYTDLEQSKKLIELGIDVNTADMMWDDWSLIDEGWKLSVGYHPEIEKDYGRKCYPAWSIAALLEILPEEITDDNGYKTYIDIRKYDLKYQIAYYTSLNWSDTIATDEYENLVDACVDMIFTLKEKNLL